MSSGDAAQRLLSNSQIEAFYHAQFVEDQAAHFMRLLGSQDHPLHVVDVGGGCGFFARRLMQLTPHRVTVIDTDATSVEACRRAGVEAVQGNALRPVAAGDEDVVTLNLILHHLVGASELETLDLQRRALRAWQGRVRAVFVNEYIYESWVRTASGWLIFHITKNRLLSRMGRMAAAVLPSLKANTFGVGVRFRAHAEWVQVFRSAGYDVQATALGEDEPIPLPWRLLLIRRIRRDSFLLQPRATA